MIALRRSRRLKQWHFTAMPAQIVKLLYLTEACDGKIIALHGAPAKNRRQRGRPPVSSGAGEVYAIISAARYP